MDCLEILPGFKAVGLSLHLPEHSALVFADVHLGFEGALNRQGVLVPPFQYREVTEHLNLALKAARPKKVVINGDLKHEFGGISGQEWAEVMRFLDGLNGYDVTLVKGNHDTIIGPIAGRGNVKLVNDLKLGTTLFVHGDKEPGSLKGVKTVVIGHEHPCIGLSEEGRVENVKCFLVGRWKGRNLIVLPSLNFVTEGVDVLKEKLLSPLLQGDISGFKAFGVEEGRILYFGRVGDLAGF